MRHARAWQRYIARRAPGNLLRRFFDVQGDARLRNRWVAIGSPSAWLGRLDVGLPPALCVCVCTG